VKRTATFLFAGLLCAGAAWSARADERSSAIVEAFRAACMAELPNFAHIDAKAAAANLPVNLDQGTPRQPEGFFNHLKSWLVTRATGAYELSATEARGPAGEVAACAITAPDPLGEDVKQDLMKALNLGPAEQEAISPDGERRSSGWWVDLQGERVILLMIDGSPAKGPGVYLNLTHRLAAGS